MTHTYPPHSAAKWYDLVTVGDKLVKVEFNHHGGRILNAERDPDYYLVISMLDDREHTLICQLNGTGEHVRVTIKELGIPRTRHSGWTRTVAMGLAQAKIIMREQLEPVSTAFVRDRTNRGFIADRTKVLAGTG